MMPVSFIKVLRNVAVIFLCWSFAFVIAGAEEPTAAETHGRDVLVFKDGDRVQGHLVEQTTENIVFQSDRFGILRVPAGNAVVIKSAKSTEAVATKTPGHAAPPATTPAPSLRTAAERAEAEKMSVWDWFSPAVLTAKMANFFGPWHGRVAFSTEVVADTTDRNNVALEGTLTRKWKNDEVQLKGRYDYSKTNELTTTDLVKSEGLWRHNFPRLWFAQYRPTAEWNRASFDKVTGAPSDYLLAQQEIGIGRSLVATASRKIRVGVSENLFDLWNTTTSVASTDAHTSRAVESAFLETEFKFPWRMSLTQRAVYYYSIASGTDGWENQIELSKKFTETLSTSIRHEIRRDNPDGRAPDYTRLKLLFGLDF